MGWLTGRLDPHHILLCCARSAPASRRREEKIGGETGPVGKREKMLKGRGATHVFTLIYYYSISFPPSSCPSTVRARQGADAEGWGEGGCEPNTFDPRVPCRYLSWYLKWRKKAKYLIAYGDFATEPYKRGEDFSLPFSPLAQLDFRVSNCESWTLL